MEEETIAPDNNPAPQPVKEDKSSVYVLRDWKEYVGESFLIIFSVFLALVATEFINSLHEKKETRELLQNIREELIINKQRGTDQLAYNQKVLRSVDSVLKDPARLKKIVEGDQFHLSHIAPNGVLFGYLDDVAWEVAKSHNISSRTSFKTIVLLTHIYDEQSRIMKLEDEVAKVLLDRESRKPENAHQTLILVRDNYKGWAVDRAPGLLKQYDEAIKALEEN